MLDLVFVSDSSEISVFVIRHLAPSSCAAPIYTHDLPSVIKNSNTLMYADDVKIFLSFNNIDDQGLIQDDISYLTSWCNTNLMELKVKKFKYMCFTRSSPTNGFYKMNGDVLELVNSFNDLGIIFDRKLVFRNHITSTVS